MDSENNNNFNNLMCNLVDLPHEAITGFAMKRVLQCIFTLMENKNVNLSARIFQKLISAIFAEFDKNADAASSTEHRQVVANVLECVQIQVTKFPSAEGKSLLERLWSLSLNEEHVHPLAAQILVKLFDDFVRDLGLERCPELLVVIQQLLVSKEKKERQSAYFLMDKLKEIFDDVANVIKCTKQQWSDYIDIVEHLEKQQKPSKLFRFLDNFKSVDNDFSPWICTLYTLQSENVSIVYNNDFSLWIHILYKKTLQSDNISIVYETVKFIVTNLKMSQLTEWNLIEDFLAASNRTQLYIVDDDDRCDPLFQNFVSETGIASIIEALINVSWKWNSVPLCEWLKSIPKEEGELPSITKELFFKLGLLVKQLEIVEYRFKAQKQMENTFLVTIEQMSLEDYLSYIEMMYRYKSDWYREHSILVSKIDSCPDLKTKIVCFNQICLKIIFNSCGEDNLNNIASKVKTLPIADHGWFPYFFLTKSRPTLFMFQDYYTSSYGKYYTVSTNNLKKHQKFFLNALNCKTRVEKSFVQKVSVDLFVKLKISNWSKIGEFKLQPEELLKQGGSDTFHHLANILETCNDRLQNNVLRTFVSLLKKYPSKNTAQNIGNYASKCLTTEEQNSLSVDIISDHLRINNEVLEGILSSTILIPKHEVLKELFQGSQYAGVARVELAMYVDYVLKQPESYINEVADELLRINKQLSEEKPNYLRNSKEHKLKFDIANALLLLAGEFECSDQLWSALFSQNDQFNITCMYESIVAYTLRSLDPLLEQLHSISTLEPNQQMSLLSVVHIVFARRDWYIFRHDQIENVFILLLSIITKGELNIQRWAKMILHTLNEICKEKGIRIADEITSSSVGNNFTDQTVEAHLKVRLLLPELFSVLSNYNVDVNEYYWFSFGMTNLQHNELSRNDWRKINKFRETIELAFIETQSAVKHETNINSMDICPKPNHMPQNITSVNDSELIVVAVFIDDLTSLNKLIQTCKALDVRTLILSDSTNLSLNSEESLKIVKIETEKLQQYLSERKLENYNIVATQNTGQNVNFVNFSFAKKTILLFGLNQHATEEENIKPILDNIIEIPQIELQNSQDLLIFRYYLQYSSKYSD